MATQKANKLRKEKNNEKTHKIPIRIPTYLSNLPD